MKIKKYFLFLLLTSSLSLLYGQNDSLFMQRSHLYLCASVGFVTPSLSFGMQPGYYDNQQNNFGGIGYADIGFGADASLTYLLDGTPLGLTCSAHYYYNALSEDSYVAQVNSFTMNHYRSMRGTGYTQLGLIVGVTLAPNGRDSWINLKLMGGVLLCYTPLVADSGYTSYYSGNLQPKGPDIIQPTHALAPTWGVGIEARPAISKKALFLFNADLLTAFPTFNTTQQITYLNEYNYTLVTQTTPYTYQLSITTIYISAGIAYKL